MNNKKVAAGLDGILNPAPSTAAPKTDRQEPNKETDRIRGNYKTVCYSIPPEVAEQIKFIAWYDRKKINAVVADAFTKYAERWHKEHPEAKQ